MRARFLLLVLTMFLFMPPAFAAPGEQPATNNGEQPAANTGEQPIPPDRILSIPMSDGTRIAAALYLPKQEGRHPVLLAASPYRFDNDTIPPSAIYPFRELGPIAWYNEHGYAYVHMDVRGTGRSGGEYRYQTSREQRDLYEVIEWIAKQDWSNGKVGGVGQSYYARAQWFMAAQNPPHLACIAPYDGNIDTYHNSAFTGGIPGEYPGMWYNMVRFINHYPANGTPRDLPYDYSFEAARHPLYDAFWKERTVAEALVGVHVPVFSIGVWGKVDLHLNGNIVGYQRVQGPKKLLVFGAANVAESVASYSSVAFHEKYLLPFYDWCLKGEHTSYEQAPNVRYALGNTSETLSAESWPPAGISTQTLYLGAGPTGSVTSLNDGALASTAPTANGGATSYDYPNKGWRIGVVGPGPDGRPDPARRVLTFTTAPMEHDTQVSGPVELDLFLASSNTDTDVFVKLSDQMPQSAADRAKGLNPPYRIVTKGWMRASHRALDPKWSKPMAPWTADAVEQKLTPGQPVELKIAVAPTAWLFKKGERIRLEIVNGDSPVTDTIFIHTYGPRSVGQDTILHDAAHPSALLLPVLAHADVHASN